MRESCKLERHPAPFPVSLMRARMRARVRRAGALSCGRDALASVRSRAMCRFCLAGVCAHSEYRTTILCFEKRSTAAARLSTPTVMRLPSIFVMQEEYHLYLALGTRDTSRAKSRRPSSFKRSRLWPPCRHVRLEPSTASRHARQSWPVARDMLAHDEQPSHHVSHDEASSDANECERA